jgi:hypothetical protein
MYDLREVVATYPRKQISEPTPILTRKDESEIPGDKMKVTPRMSLKNIGITMIRGSSLSAACRNLFYFFLLLQKAAVAAKEDGEMTENVASFRAIDRQAIIMISGRPLPFSVTEIYPMTSY